MPPAMPQSAEPTKNTPMPHSQDGFAPIHVRKLAIDRDHGRAGEQIAGGNPADQVDPVEIAHNRRQSGRHNRLIERGQKQAQQHSAKNEQLG